MKPLAGLGLLDFSAWIRRQSGLRFFYRHVPQRWRDRISAILAERARQRLRFPRTSAWDAPLPQAIRKSLAQSSGPAVCGIPGVNVIGYMRGQFGLGECARAYARALIGAGVPVSLSDVDIGLAHGWDDHSLDAWISEELPWRTTLFFINPDFWHQAMEKIGRARLQGHYIVACWFWELERVPDEWIPVIDEVDEIMVSTGFVEQVFKRVTRKPVWKVPYPMPAILDSGLKRADFGLEEGKFVFLASFDFNSFVARKNPFAVIDAFVAAFPGDRTDVRLLVKTSNGFRHPEKLRELLEAAGADRRIVVRDDLIDRAHISALQRCCDAYVSLHRAEGLGLNLAECMIQGKPVIATAWSGNMEFMDAQNSCLVDYRFVEVGAGEYHAAAGQRWAEAGVAQAAEWMRRLVDEPGLARRIGERAREVSARLSPRHAGAELAARLLAAAQASGRMTP